MPLKRLFYTFLPNPELQYPLGDISCTLSLRLWVYITDVSLAILFTGLISTISDIEVQM